MGTKRRRAIEEDSDHEVTAKPVAASQEVTVTAAPVSGVTNANGEIVSNLMPNSIFDKNFGDPN